MGNNKNIFKNKLQHVVLEQFCIVVRNYFKEMIMMDLNKMYGQPE